MEMIEINCPACGASEYKILFSDHNRRDNIDCSGTYVQCKECSLVYLRDRPPWEEIVKFYSSLDEDQTANAGLANVEELRQQADMPVPRWYSSNFPYFEIIRTGIKWRLGAAWFKTFIDQLINKSFTLSETWALVLPRGFHGCQYLIRKSE